MRARLDSSLCVGFNLAQVKPSAKSNNVSPLNPLSALRNWQMSWLKRPNPQHFHALVDSAMVCDSDFL
jgi:hypothetical protein